MKIAFVRTASNILRYGGYNIQEIGLAKALMPYGVSTDVYARFSNIDVITEIAHDEYGNKVVVHPLKGKQIWHELMYYPTLKHDLLNGGYDMVQLLDDSQMMLPGIFKALKKSGIKTILWQGMYRNFSGIVARCMQIVYDAMFACTLNKYSDLKIAKTEAAKDYLLKKKYQNVIVLPVGLDEVSVERNETFDKEMAAFKVRHSKLLLYIGAIESRRNPNFLIDIMKQIKDDNVGLVMIGKGPLRESIINRIKNEGLEDKILTYDAVPNKNLISVYKRANVFLLPTAYEIYGMVVMESLAYGVPVISTPEAGPQYLLSDKRYGTCIPLDTKKWLTVIDYYLNNQNTEDCQKARVTYVNQNYRWPLIAEKYFKIISSM